MTNALHNADVLSIKDLTLAQIDLILSRALQFKKQKSPEKSLAGKIIANCFFEPSTRTRLSFESAALRLGAQVIGFSDDKNISTRKGETLSDSIRVISNYADLLVIRHPKEGAARLAAEVSEKPVINAGDAANQHPTQALIDLFTLRECQGKIEGLNIALVGDLKYGRSIHSLAEACALFNVRLFLVAPPLLAMPEKICDYLKRQSVRFSFHQTLEEIIPKVDVIYMQRLQKERLEPSEFELTKHLFVLTLSSLQKAKPNLKILHALPRAGEIEPAVDQTPYAYYFQQAANGVWVREALLDLLLRACS